MDPGDARQAGRAGEEAGHDKWRTENAAGPQLVDDGHVVLRDLSERPYIIVGALAFIGLLALAVTSNRFSIRKLGRKWKTLHRLDYAIQLQDLLHMLWVVRADLGEWLAYALIGGTLLLMRLSSVAGGLQRAGALFREHPKKIEI